MTDLNTKNGIPFDAATEFLYQKKIMELTDLLEDQCRINCEREVKLQSMPKEAESLNKRLAANGAKIWVNLALNQFSTEKPKQGTPLFHSETKVYILAEK